MNLRKIVKINEELCDGCGLCVPSCAEGALKIVNGKAKLLSETYCDGLGACIGYCPRGALTIEERVADPFDEEGAKAHVEEENSSARGCPSAEALISEGSAQAPRKASESALRQWPVHLRLVTVDAPFLKRANLLVTSDCVPFAYPDFHGSMLKDRTVLFGCPKFDDAGSYADKLSEILRRNDVRGITVVHMEVPCCYGLDWVVKKALEASGKAVPAHRHIVTVKGELKEVAE